MEKVSSLDDKWYYITEIVNKQGITSGGWLNPETREWLPFAFWDVRVGKRTKATKEEITLYKQRLGDILAG